MAGHNCRVCNREFKPQQHNLDQGMGKYCSRTCSGMAQRTRQALFLIDGYRVVTGTKGYLFVLTPGMDTLLQRYIVEAALGKSLPKQAVVHHIDGNKLNNGHDNLLVLENNAEHRLIHQKMDLKAKGVILGVSSYCGSCKQVKPVEMFSIKKSNPTGRYSWCKSCCARIWKTNRISKGLPIRENKGLVW